MGGYFTLGELKVRPGVYKRYENAGTQAEGVVEKVAAVVVAANWGPLNKAVIVGNGDDISEVIGTGPGVNILTEIFAGGVSECVVVRAGTGGEPGMLTLKDNDSTPNDVIQLKTKYTGNRAFTLTIRTSLYDESVKEAILYDGTKELERRQFNTRSSPSESEVDNFVAAFSDSRYVLPRKLADGSSLLADVSQSPFEQGTNPNVNVSAYSDALAALEAERWHYLCCGAQGEEVNAVLAAFVDRIHQDGAYGRAVIAEGHSIDLDTRINHAKAYNDEKVIYVLNSWVGANGTVYEGSLAAARICGMLAATPSTDSLTHAVIAGAAKLNESLTNSQVKKAITSGCLVFSLNSSRQVIIEKAINTLVTPAANQDDGWKKIKRTDIRFELMDRIEKTVDVMVGKVNNDTNGRAAVVAAAQRVIDAMIGETKLLSGSCLLDTANKPAGDSAWFVISVDDVDSLETIYLTFRFRFSQNS